MDLYIAFAATAIFVYFLFLIDSKRKPKSSYALWIPLIWMLYSASRPLSFWLNPEGSTSSLSLDKQYLEGSPFDRNVYIVLIILSIYVLIKRNVKWISILQRNMLFGIWIVYCVISILWSDFQFVAFKRWVKEIGLFLSILVVLTEVEPFEAVKTLIKRFAYITIPYSIVLIIFFPYLGIYGDLEFGMLNYAGVAYNKNGLGRICLISGIFLFSNLISIRNIHLKSKQNIKSNIHSTNVKEYNTNPERAFLQYFFLIIIFYMLSMLHSATSLGGLLIGMLVYLGLGFNVMKKNLKMIGIFTVIILIIGVILQFTLDLATMFITSMGRDLTLTGRTRMWIDLLAMRTNPLIGVGYGSFWLGKRMTSLWDLYRVQECHNGYLSVYLELGMIGLSLLLLIIASVFKKIKNDLITNFYLGRFEMALFIIVLLYNITEDAFANSSLIWFLFILIGIHIPGKMQKVAV